MTLINPDNHMAVMAALFAIAAIGFAGEKTRIGSHMTGAVIPIDGGYLLGPARRNPHRHQSLPGSGKPDPNRTNDKLEMLTDSTIFMLPFSTRLCKLPPLPSFQKSGQALDQTP